MLCRLGVLMMSVLAITGCGVAPRTPLAKAAAYGTAADVKLQIQDATAEQIQSALFPAARFGNRLAISALVEAGANLNQPAGANSWPPLMHAIHKNQLGAMKELLNLGADVNYIAGNGQTPLIMAAGYGYADMVAVLLEKGADPAIQMIGGLTALDLAITGTADIDRFTIGNCQTDTVRTLLENSPKRGLQPTMLARAALEAGRCMEIKKLLETRY